MAHILIVEDEPRIADFLDRGLRAAGHVTSTASDGTSGLYLALRCISMRPIGLVIRTPIGKQRLECLTLGWGFRQQSTEQGFQAVAIEPWLQPEESPEAVNIGRTDRHTVDP